MNFKNEAISIKNELIDIRRTLREYPKIGMGEYQTSRFIKNFLENQGIKFEEVSKTSVYGIIRGTKKNDEDKKKTIALRGDIDGLSIIDKKVCDYSSKVNGKVHACGHDAHIIILLGAAKILNENKHLFSGNIKLSFEPAEETMGGARFMIKGGVLENPRVDCVCGLHVEETLECGTIMLKGDVINAASNPFTITIKGSGGHGAYLHTAVDPIAIASHIVLALRTIVSREINTANPAVITVGSIHGGTAQNMIPEEAEISGIIRTMSKGDRVFAEERLVEIVDGVCRSSGATAKIEIEESYPSLHNDGFMVDLFKIGAEKITGKESILIQKNAKMGIESLAYFASERPAVFYFLGSRNKSRNIIYPAHSSLFDIDEDCLPLGVAMQCQMVFECLTRS